MPTSLISTDDNRNLQDALSNLRVWFHDWQLIGNVSKCHVLHLYKKNNPLMNYDLDDNRTEPCYRPILIGE